MRYIANSDWKWNKTYPSLWNPSYSNVEQYKDNKKYLQKYRIDITKSVILDIGCGFYGAVAILLKRDGAKEVYGIDIDPRLNLSEKDEEYELWAERKKRGYNEILKQAGISPESFWEAKKKTNLLNMDMDELGFKDNCFDFVYAWASIEFSRNLSSVFAEIKRILKKGGYAFIKHLFYYGYKGYRMFGPRKPRRLWGHLFLENNDPRIIASGANQVRKTELEKLMVNKGFSIIEINILDYQKISKNIYKHICEKHGPMPKEDLEISNIIYVCKK